MLWIKALHIIFVVTWFSGLFYLPRLFVYHAMSEDTISQERFKLMERKLYFGITMPSAVLATIFGIWLLCLNFSAYISLGWMQAKLALVAVLWIYHLMCGYYWWQFKTNKNKHSHVFYRWFNEIPVVILMVVVILVVVKP
ncbi:MAG TPA: CopD family protein [Gammaproteobacteria bacterium]|nr:CopD family protein [Gammaproteobacteria bacterium]